MKKYIVKRPKDIVEVLILPNKDGSGYQYVNLTKGHICPCKFKTELEALRDMDKKVSEDKVLYYEEIEEKKKMTKDELEKEARFRTKGWKEQENCVQAYIAGAKPRENENYQTQRKSEPCPLWCSHRDILTKANEIIKNLLTLSIPIDYAKCPGPLQKIAEAEQFLKEVSE